MTAEAVFVGPNIGQAPGWDRFSRRTNMRLSITVKYEVVAPRFQYASQIGFFTTE